MSKGVNDGGPAFPMPHVSNVNNGTMEWGESGMSLRAWLAGQALTSRGLYGANVREKEVAEECVRIADALIAKLNEGNQ